MGKSPKKESQMIKLIAIDLDGTLLNDKKEISKTNQEVLAQAKAKGVKIVLCTGRPLKAILPYLDVLDLRSSGDYSITFNGGLVQKNDTGEIVDKQTLSVADVQDLLAVAETIDMPLDVLADDVVLCFPTSLTHQTIYPTLNPLLVFQPTDKQSVSAKTLYNKAVVAYDQEELDQWIPKIPAEFKERYEVIKTRSNLLEFMPKGVTKAYGIQLLAQELGIEPAEVMAIGDEENDLSMIAYAGVGVAMGNAISAVKEAADVVTATNEEDGVAKIVSEYVLV